MIVVHWLISPNALNTHKYPLLANLLQWLRSNPNCKLSHIHHEGVTEQLIL